MAVGLPKLLIYLGIKHDFSALKRARMYSPINTSIDEIIRNYCNKNVSFLFKINIYFLPNL